MGRRLLAWRHWRRGESFLSSLKLSGLIHATQIDVILTLVLVVLCVDSEDSVQQQYQQ